MNQSKLIEQIKKLKEDKNAAFLVHNYQRPEIQQLADYLGDSLELARRAKELPNPVIVFCGVHFMAESAALLAPEKTVLLPVLEAGCPLADCATPEMVREARREHPDAAFIAYINTSAAVKAEVDVVCTSANALEIIKKFSDREVCYLPDKNLAGYAARKLGQKIIQWPGQCYVHDTLITPKLVSDLKKKHPEALVMVHPEVSKEVLDQADYIAGTGGMIAFTKTHKQSEFIVVTESGLVDRMRREMPEKSFIAVPGAVCGQMKLTTLQAVYDSLALMQHKITVNEKIAGRARKALKKMLELSH